jgi:hypothetical protein
MSSAARDISISASKNVPGFRRHGARKKQSLVFRDDDGYRWVKAAEFCRRTGIGPITLARYAAAGLVPMRKAGRYKLYRIDAIEGAE